jgi:sensor domain CHASE-containing protein
LDLKTLVLGKDFLFVLLTAGFFSFLMFIVFSKMLRQNRVEGEAQVNAVNNQILNDISSLERKIASRNVLFEKN